MKGRCSSTCFVKSSTFLFLLTSFVTSAQGYTIHRAKRGTVTIGDLPSIIPPTKIKNGESKFPNPGWTHCIKYLTADVRWRSIRGVNMKKLQATQFQCSWYITTETPGSQIRVSFEKLDFGGDISTSCTQQFLELIDIKTGVAQARMCGNKRYGDYVSVGQRLRIDIQGEEPLVAKLRGGEEAFVINYKSVREPAGFRVGGASKATVLKNRVKQTVGTAVDRTKTPVTRGKNIFGVKNQPGANDPPRSDSESSGRPSLAIWQVVLIIVISFAVVSCIVGVIVKRMIFDKRKQEKYMKAEEDSENWEKGNDPPEYSAAQVCSNHPGNESFNLATHQRPAKVSENKLERSKSKPETTAEKAQKATHRNSHGDINSKSKISKHPKKSTSDGNPSRYNGILDHISETIIDSSGPLRKQDKKVDDTPLSRAPRKNKSKDVAKVITDPPRVMRHNEGIKRKKKRKTDENDNKVKAAKSARRKNRNASTKHQGVTESGQKRTSVKPTTGSKKSGEIDAPKSRPDKSHKKRKQSKRSNDKLREDKPASKKVDDSSKQPSANGITTEQNSRKKRERSKRNAGSTGTKKPKTVSSGVRKTTMTSPNGKNPSKKKKTSHRNKHSEANGQTKSQKTREAKREKSSGQDGISQQRRK